MSAPYRSAGTPGENRPEAEQLTVFVRGVKGFVFQASEPGSFCFVPEKFITVDSSGAVLVDEVGYLADGWGARNLRRSEADVPGHFLFPDVTAGRLDPALPDVARFLRRLV